MESTDANKREPAKLKDFIEDHSKLITTLAAFIALTGFSTQFDNDTMKGVVPALTLLAATLVAWELWNLLPERPREWRLEIFSFVWAYLVMSMVLYWFWKFRGIWISAVFNLIKATLFFTIIILTAIVLTRVIEFLARVVFKRPIATHQKTRISQFSFLLCAILLMCVAACASLYLSSHPIVLHPPSWLEQVVARLVSEIDSVHRIPRDEHRFIHIFPLQ